MHRRRFMNPPCWCVWFELPTGVSAGMALGNSVLISDRPDRLGWLLLMTTTSRSEATNHPRPTQPSIRAFLLEHRAISFSALALVIIVVGVVIPDLPGVGSWKVTDSTSCAAWSSASRRQQAAYSRLYISRHGPLANGATAPASIEAAINHGCVQASAYDAADTITVLEALNKQS